LSGNGLERLASPVVGIGRSISHGRSACHLSFFGCKVCRQSTGTSIEGSVEGCIEIQRSMTEGTVPKGTVQCFASASRVVQRSPSLELPHAARAPTDGFLIVGGNIAQACPSPHFPPRRCGRRLGCFLWYIDKRIVEWIVLFGFSFLVSKTLARGEGSPSGHSSSTGASFSGSTTTTTTQRNSMIVHSPITRLRKRIDGGISRSRHGGRGIRIVALIIPRASPKNASP